MDPYVPEYLRKMKDSKGIVKIILFVALPAVAIIGVFLLLARRKKK